MYNNEEKEKKKNHNKGNNLQEIKGSSVENLEVVSGI